VKCRQAGAVHAGVAVLVVLLGARTSVGAELDAVHALMQEGQFEAALAEVDAQLAADEGDPQARFVRGVVLAELGRDEEAIALFAALTEDHPGLPEPHNNLAVLYAARGDYDQARAALLVAIGAHPSYAAAYENLGDIYARLARIAYDRVLALEAGNTAVPVKLALLRELLAGQPVSRVPPPTPVASKTVPTPVASKTAPTPVASKTAPTPVASKAAPTPVASVDHSMSIRPAEPVPANAEARPPSADTRQSVAAAEVVEVVESWAQAWSGQDVEAYLRHYGADFRPPRGESREQWERARRSRLSRPAFIAVSVGDVAVEFGRGELVASATFDQAYRSNTYQDRTRKRLDLVRTGSEWQIVRERSLR
jgi:hypothetical protein